MLLNPVARKLSSDYQMEHQNTPPSSDHSTDSKASDAKQIHTVTVLNANWKRYSGCRMYEIRSAVS